MSQHTLLIEIGTEELPSKILHFLAKNFAIHIGNELDIHKIHYGKVNWFATSRRLAAEVVKINNLQNDSILEKRGPAVSQAFDINGYPTKAAEKWANSCGIHINQAKRILTNKGEWLVYRAKIKGKPIQELLCIIINQALANMLASKMIRWNDNIWFIRPVHTITLLLDNIVIKGNILGINTDRIVLGHRFMGKQTISLEHAKDYKQILLNHGRVIVDYFQRREKIRKDIEAAAKKLGGRVKLCESLLEEITSLVEWPVVFTARFKKEFLVIPKEALICIMKIHQKYFPVYGPTNNLLPYFIFVANIESRDPKQIISGNEKVIHLRLADAEFFFNSDRKQKLEEYLPQLNMVLFQKNLGTLYDKSKRIQTLAIHIASQINADINKASRAALLSKCDLMTNMVFEFPDIQGIMGMHYARYDGEAEEVALAQKEQYQPLFAKDLLPTTLVSCAVAIADKIDTLVGIMGINQHPKGNKDPFALRRNALGILRIIVEKKLQLDLQILIEKSIKLYENKLTNDIIANDVMNFMFIRFHVWYQEQGYSIDTIRAVSACRPTNPLNFDARLQAVNHFRNSKNAELLIAVNKRISNILNKSIEPIRKNLQISIFKDPIEIELATSAILLNKRLQLLFASNRYYDALVEMTKLCNNVNIFFKKVMVMVDDSQIRISRLTLLAYVHNLFMQVADISLL